MKSSTLVYLLLFLLMAGCAQIRSVEGGPKDIRPPELLDESVPDGQTLWNGQQLIFEFDEYIQLQDVQNQIIISPAIFPAPTFQVKGKKLNVQWESPLASNTTYTFQFGNAITDITENNVVNLERVYSTGEALDSLHLQFSVVDGWDKKALENSVVALLKKPFHPDSVNVSSYQRKSSQGSCHFQHLPNQRFYVVAFQDNNKDGQYTAGEWMDWMDTPVKPSSTPDTTLLIVSPVRVNSPNLLGAAVDSFGHAQWHWPTNEIPKVVVNDNQKGNLFFLNDTAHYYLSGIPDNQNHTIQVQWGNGEQDSLAIPFFSRAIEDFTIPNRNIKAVLFPSETAVIPCFLPIDSINSDRIQWEIGKQKQSVKITYNWPEMKVQPREIKNEDYSIRVLPKCFQTNSILWPADTMVFTGKMEDVEDRGEVLWNITPFPSMGYFVLSSLQEDKSVAAIRWPKKMVLTPGKYQLRWIEDINQNIRWDPSDYMHGIHAERVELYSKPIEVRANWTQVVEWKIP